MVVFTVSALKEFEQACAVPAKGLPVHLVGVKVQGCVHLNPDTPENKESAPLKLAA
jgi:hypothetical protein